MNIIIPIGGKGERFKNKGYDVPKPLIKIFDKEMIFYILDNLNYKNEDKIYIIYYNLEQYNFENIINNKYPNIKLIKINKQTKGAAETILLGIKEILKIEHNKNCLLLDCDTFYTENIIEKYRNINGNAVFYTYNIDKNPIYSYIEFDDNHKIIKIQEKNKISDYANTGIYCFENIYELEKYAEYIIKNDIKFNNEYYISCIIHQMIKDNFLFKSIELNNDNVFNLGTPEQLTNYINNTFLFLFDLDGTIILSDDIYFEIWSEILKKYNIVLTYELFCSKIQGNSDETVIRTIIPNKYNDLILNISNIKDDLFLKNISKIKLIDGILEFIEYIKNKGHKCSIVTNCNRKVSEKILEYINLNVDKLIIGNECKKSKPYPDPYKEAINFFNSTNEKAIIFEDSKTGIQSGKNTYPKCLIGIETIYNNNELKNIGVDLTIKNYLNVNLGNILSFNNKDVEYIKKFIKNSLMHINIINIEICNYKLKGGFISDVISVKIIKEDGVIDCVLKLENKNITFLSKMANNLGLYQREYYFYNDISNYVPIKIPKFYGLIKNENYDTVGILMNNLSNLNYSLNLDLNKEKIDVSLKIIEKLALLHSKFWNKNLNQKFKELKRHNDPMFNPTWYNFIKEKWPIFKEKWSCLLNKEQLEKAENIVNNFQNIQNYLSDKNLTLCHGDVKSANIFYKLVDNDYEPFFIDWQYIIEGKGVQDLVFFMIESFDIHTIDKYFNIFKDYYYIKLMEYGVSYTKDEYNTDFKYSICYFPFFVAIWFGTLNEDELIDKNFPFFFIQKLFNFLKYDYNDKFL